jgi:hypothetical protein
MKQSAEKLSDYSDATSIFNRRFSTGIINGIIKDKSVKQPAFGRAFISPTPAWFYFFINKCKGYQTSKP